MDLAVCAVGGFAPRCCSRMAAWSLGIAVRRKGRRLSPLLANLFMHYAFDVWMAREFPAVRSNGTATMRSFTAAARRRPVKCGMRSRPGWLEVGLALHPGKTLIVYCKDATGVTIMRSRRLRSGVYEFRPRLAKNRYGRHFVYFLPAVSTDAIKAMGAGDPVLALGQAQRQVPRRPCAYVQQHRAGMDQLLRTLLPSELLTFFGGSTATWCGGPSGSTNGSRREKRRAMAWLAEIASAISPRCSLTGVSAPA